jgi:hypothetical protein
MSEEEAKKTLQQIADLIDGLEGKMVPYNVIKKMWPLREELARTGYPYPSKETKQP